MKRFRSNPDGSHRAFTIIEVLVSVAITGLIAGLIVALVTNVSGFWSRTSGRLSAEAQARYVLDQLTLDLQSALYRDDGKTWLAATISTNTTNSSFWNNTGTTGSAIKPGNAAGSLQFVATGNLTDNSDRGPRFGIAGTWLRFFTMKRGTNTVPSNATTTANNTSAPVAVAYQIVRRATSTAPNNDDRRYLLHRSEVRPAAQSTARNGTLQAGFDIVATAYQPGTSGGVQRGDPGEIRYAQLDSVVAENVVDFGVRLYTYVPNATTGALVLTRTFPKTSDDNNNRTAISCAATLPPRVPDDNGAYTSCFPEVVDISIRVLTDEGARVLAGYESNPQKVFAAPGRTAQQGWWDIVLANSQVFTRRILVNAKPL